MADGPAHTSGREADSLSPEAQRWFHAVKAGDLLTVTHMLHCAGHTDVARRALTEQRCDRGATALCWAAMHGHVDVARALLNAGADTEARDYRAGGTPLVWGAAHNQVETIRLLLESGHAFAGRSTGAPAGAVLQHVVGGDGAMPPPPWSTVSGTPWGETPLMVAVQFGHEQAGRLLANAGHLEERNEHGQSALHIAAMFGKDACCLALIQAGAQLDARDSDDATPLMLAVENAHGCAALTLLWHGAAFELPTNDSLLRLWQSGALLSFSIDHRRLFPAACRRDVASLLLVTAGRHGGGDEIRGNPLRRLKDSGLLMPLCTALLRAHWGTPRRHPAETAAPQT